MKELNLPFYLTGGTALSRFYYNHRYSDDLDFFINASKMYGEYIRAFWNYVESKKRERQFDIEYNAVVRAENFTQIILKKEETILQLDFVNDIDIHYGELIDRQDICSIDNWRNILSNKISALYRFEPKDYADIWIIWKNENFLWPDLIREAKTKEAGIDSFLIADLLKTIPVQQLQLVKWAESVDCNKIKDDLSQIGDEILGIYNNR